MTTTEIMEQLKQARIDALRREFSAVDDGSFDRATSPDGLSFREDEPVLVNVTPAAERKGHHRI
jgi:hypothetical protein